MATPSLFGDVPAQNTVDKAAPGTGWTSAAPSLSTSQTQSLYRKYRPQSFAADDLVGQEQIVRTLQNAVALNRVTHAYLFCGPRGTGKTTTARLLAKAVNCLDPDPARRPCNRCEACLAIASGSATDVVEIDAASNRGIDDIRELRERVKYAPTQLKTKFYIIDEAHQITGAAANAFLKTLEEPPPHTKFVLATTDPEELLPTIVSRCQRFDFRRIGLDAIIARLRLVAAAEGIEIDDDALRVVARNATGSLRDALGLLDQLAVYGDEHSDGRQIIDAGTVRALLGVSRNDRVETLVTALADRDVSLALATVNGAVEAGEDARQLNRQFVTYLRILLHQLGGGSPDADDTARELAARFQLGDLVEHVRIFSEIDYKIRHSSYGHLPLEVALVQAIIGPGTPSVARASQPIADVPAPRASTPPRADPERTVEQRPPTTTLRDRVRGVATPKPAPNGTAMPAVPTMTTPLSEPTPMVAKPRPASVETGSVVTVEQLIDLWPKIRLDVKAVNRRIEALLSSVDPVRVQGNLVVLAAAYAFHRDRMNSDEVRSVVEEVVGRLLKSQFQVSCVLRGEEHGIAATVPAPGGSRPAPVQSREMSEPPPVDDPYDDGSDDLPRFSPLLDERRLNAAKNIFDADEMPS